MSERREECQVTPTWAACAYVRERKRGSEWEWVRVSGSGSECVSVRVDERLRVLCISCCWCCCFLLSHYNESISIDKMEWCLHSPHHTTIPYQNNTQRSEEATSHTHHHTHISKNLGWKGKQFDDNVCWWRRGRRGTANVEWEMCACVVWECDEDEKWYCAFFSSLWCVCVWKNHQKKKT